ncbi:MAG TPA: hypothetical protein VLE96_07555 [Chlamydiales bacterium]|nr:hypothetical protein [Chlamydiales bacterium]
MTDPIDPNKTPGTPPQADETAHRKGPPPKYGEMTAKPLTFLGMKFTGPEAEKLWNTILQQVNSQIQHEQARALKAMRKLRKSSTGEGGDD